MYNVQELQIFAESGMSINQLVRKLKLPSDFHLRKLIKGHPSLYQIFTKNGMIRQWTWAKTHYHGTNTWKQ